MRITLAARIRSLFASDRYSFWWNEITEEEKELAHMDVWELAAVVRQTNQHRRVVAEHMLNVRLANIQARASRRAGWVSAFGAVLAAVASFYLGQLFASKPPEVACTCNYRNEQQPLEKQLQPSKPSVVNPSPANGAVKESDSKSQGKQPNAATKP